MSIGYSYNTNILVGWSGNPYNTYNILVGWIVYFYNTNILVRWIGVWLQEVPILIKHLLYIKQALELRQLEMGTHAATPAILLIFQVSELPIPETLMFCLPKLLSL